MNVKANLIASSLVALVISSSAAFAAGWKPVTGEELKTLLVNKIWIGPNSKSYYRDDGKRLSNYDGARVISEWKMQDDGRGYCVRESCYVVQTKKGKYRAKGISGPYKGGTWKFEVRNGIIDFGIATTRMLETSLTENGARVRLETVIFRPPGEGPFPLLVFNHGSTGTGENKRLFGITWLYQTIGEFFAKKGWMVAIPYRRGRGKSDGLYDEGFSRNRADGYSCNPRLSLPGAERALRDIEAAMEVLVRDPDVDPKRILIGGQSRGGILAVAYAGEHPQQVRGVINLVGGWMGTGCDTASVINQSLFLKGAKFPGPMLWIYGFEDPYYPLSHSKQNFQAFLAAGGQGSFYTFRAPRGSGHRIWRWPRLWKQQVNDYLESLGLGASS